MPFSVKNPAVEPNRAEPAGLTQIFSWVSLRFYTGSTWRVTHLRELRRVKTKVKRIGTQLGMPEVYTCTNDQLGLSFDPPGLQSVKLESNTSCAKFLILVWHRAGATDFGLRGQLVPIKGPWRKGPR